MEIQDRKYILLCIIIFAALSIGGLFLYYPDGESAAENDAEVVEITNEAEQGRNDTALVYVVGAVREPGVYELPAGSRLYEAVQKAGDLLPYADLESINLSEKIEDGTKIYIPLNLNQTNIAAAGMVNINTAGEAELITLPGVGPKTADKIITYRREHGEFKSKEELKEVPTIGEEKMKKIAGKIVL